MLLSESLYQALEASLKGLSPHNLPIRSIVPVSGGDINRAYRIKTAARDYFVKVNNHAQATPMFLAESKGLALLANTLVSSHVPQTISVGNAHGEGFLLMEWIDTGDKLSDRYQEALGRLLASQHRQQADRYGLDHDNFVGQL